jgi:hypothetical protein
VGWQPDGNDVSPAEEDIVRIGYQATASEDTKDLVRAVVNCSVCEFVKASKVYVVTTYKCPTNPITNPNPVSNHQTRGNTFE